MADFDLVLRALPRIGYACRTRRVADPGEKAGVSAHQAVVLSHLDDADPTMVGELAEHLGVTPSTMSLTLKRLEEAGYVRRDRDPADRRVVNVRLTDAGVRVRDARTELDPELVERMLSLLPEARRREALRGLASLAEAADALVRRARDQVDAQLGREG
jgi:DNA-binding MarR family transcriptional regulator